MEKYRIQEMEALAFADFLMPCLRWDPDKRITAQKLLEHPWLSMPSNYEVRLSEEEFEAKK
jgi:serine/threonine protein kinase